MGTSVPACHLGAKGCPTWLPIAHRPVAADDSKRWIGRFPLSEQGHMVTVVLPWPPSVNSYYRSVNGRAIMSKRGRVYRDAVMRAVRACGAAKHLDCRLAVEITLHPRDRRKFDIDNTVKAVFDGMQKAGVFLDDSQVDRLLVTRSTVEPGGVAVVKIKEWRGE